MDQAEKDRIGAYIKAKNDEMARERAEYEATRTPERDAEVARVIQELASLIVITQTGPNEFHLSAMTPEEAEAKVSGRSIDADAESQLFHGVITKAMLMVLPEDCWMVSGAMHNDGTPVLTARVGNMGSRAELWALMRSRRVVGRNFWVLRDEAALIAHLERWQQIMLKAQDRR